MTPFTTLSARAVGVPLANIDTDQLIPARFMSRPRSAGYGAYLMRDARVSADGASLGHPLDAPEAVGARILVARRNFGGGSSREAAVYALGDIFASNAVNNGLLPAQVTEEVAEALLTALQPAGDLVVDLEARTITAAGATHAFAIDPVWRVKLLNGWDDLDLTLSREAEIQAFAAGDRIRRPWAGVPEGF
jgi:3-isopropylmalate/(R)-2-methylmalate dehydratase small subunit